MCEEEKTADNSRLSSFFYNVKRIKVNCHKAAFGRINKTCVFFLNLYKHGKILD